MEKKKNEKVKMDNCQNKWGKYHYQKMGGFSFGFILLIILIGLILIGTTNFTITGQNYNGFQLLANTIGVQQVLTNPPSWSGWTALGDSKGTILQLQFGVSFCIIVVPLLVFLILCQWLLWWEWCVWLVEWRDNKKLKQNWHKLINPIKYYLKHILDMFFY